MLLRTHFLLHAECREMSEFSISMVRVLICIATDFEAARLRDHFGSFPEIELITTGVGPVNAAHATTVAIMRQRPDVIISCGVGGAYPSSTLHVGDVACADLEIYGDLGAESPGGFLDMRALGFPVVRNDEALFNEIPMTVFPASRRTRFVTVSTCTGTEDTARDIETRTRGAVENMEGAAIAHVAHLNHIQVGEVRGISNIVTNRNKASWRLSEASEAAQTTLIEWINRQDFTTSGP